MRPEDTRPDTPERRLAMAELMATKTADELGERILQFIEEVTAMATLPRAALVWQLARIVEDIRTGERLRLGRLKRGAAS